MATCPNLTPKIAPASDAANTGVLHTAKQPSAVRAAALATSEPVISARPESAMSETREDRATTGRTVAHLVFLPIALFLTLLVVGAAVVSKSLTT